MYPEPRTSSSSRRTLLLGEAVFLQGSLTSAVHLFAQRYLGVSEVMDDCGLSCCGWPSCDSSSLLDDSSLERDRQSQEQRVQSRDVETFACDLVDGEQDERITIIRCLAGSDYQER